MSRALLETSEYRRGTVVELKVYSYLASLGRPVARVRHGGEIAPALTVWDRRVTMPDIQAHMRTGMVWIEVKDKTTCGVFEVAGIRTTGVDARNLTEYRDVEALTAYPVYVVFVHEDEREIRFCRASDKWMDGYGKGASMRYQDYDRLPHFAAYDDVMGTPTRALLRPDAPLFAPDDGAVQLSLVGEGA